MALPGFTAQSAIIEFPTYYSKKKTFNQPKITINQTAPVRHNIGNPYDPPYESHQKWECGAWYEDCKRCCTDLGSGCDYCGGKHIEDCDDWLRKCNTAASCRTMAMLIPDYLAFDPDKCVRHEQQHPYPQWDTPATCNTAREIGALCSREDILESLGSGGLPHRP